jgi:hypothetical protein
MKIFENGKTARLFVNMSDRLSAEDRIKFSVFIKSTHDAITTGDDETRKTFYLTEEDLNSAFNIFQNAKKLELNN